jgi:hypothetical protein
MIRSHKIFVLYFFIFIGTPFQDSSSKAVNSFLSEFFSGNGRIDLMSPSGKFNVSSFYLQVIDSSRKEIAAAHNNPRILNLRIWYPTDFNNSSDKMKYMINADYYVDVYGPELIGIMKSINTNGSQKKEVSDLKEKYPLLIFSPGFAANHTLYTMLSEDLASHGYIVAAIDHPYLNTTVINDELLDPTNGFWHASPVAPGKEQTNEEYKQHLENALVYFGEDVQFVLDQFISWNHNDPNKILTGKIDTGKIAVAGHSAGYLPALGALVNDSRINTMISYDVALDEGDPDVKKKLKKDLLIFRFEYAVETGENFLKKIGGSAYDVYIKNATHFSVMDFPFIESISADDKAMTDQVSETLRLIQSLTISYLNDKFFNTNENFRDVLIDNKSFINVTEYHFNK